MSSLRLTTLLLSAGLALSAQTILKTSFAPEEMKGWKLPSFAKVEPTDSGHCLVIRLDKVIPGDDGRAVLPFDFSKYAGKTVRMDGEMSYENVSKPRQSWNGTKFMMVFATKGGQRYWKHPSGEHGTSGWKRVSVGFNVPEDAQPGTIELGLQDSTGTIRFRNLAVELIDPAKVFPRLTPPDYRCEYTDRVQKEPVRRGVMSTGEFSPAVITSHLPDLKQWGANLYRWQLIRNWHARNDNQDRDEYLNWIRGKVPGTLQVLDKAHELGIKVVLDLHVAPGGRRDGGHMNMFEQPRFADTFLEAWRILATAVKGHPALFGYDLINEPSQPFEVVYCDYLTLQYRAAQVVRSIDPDTPIIIEAKDWDAASSFDVLSPLPMKDVIYQAHMYFPGGYTHQGVGSNPKGGDLYYPNPAKGFTKEGIRNYVQAARDFQLKHGARIYVGEFSAIRWAKGAEIFLRDAIDIFEEYGWDWSYHAFREWSGWSVEHSEDPNDEKPVKHDTPRKKALLKGFSNNAK